MLKWVVDGTAKPIEELTREEAVAALRVMMEEAEKRRNRLSEMMSFRREANNASSR